MSAVAAVLGAAAPGRPTGVLVADIVLRASFAGAVVWFGGTGRRWTWFVLAGGAGVLSRGLVPVGLACVALGLAYYSAFAPRRMRAVGGIVCLLSVEILLRLPHRLPAALTALVVASVCAPCLWSGYRLHRRGTRKRIRTAAGVVLLFCAVSLLGYGVAFARGRAALERGVAEARVGLDAARSGDRDEAVRRFTAATRSLKSGRSAVDAWWARPARVLPVVGQQAGAIADVAHSGADLVGEARDTAEFADYRRLRATKGQIDLRLVEAYQRPVADLEARLDAEEHRLRRRPSPWLLPPLRERINSFAHEVTGAAHDANLASQVLDVAPDLLGGHGARRYALLFVTPSETREAGGFMGNFGELTAVNGKLDLVRTGRSHDLDPTTPQELATRKVTGVSALPVRYRYYKTSQFSGNITGTQDFPTVARTFANLYRQAGGAPIDGAILVDPYGLAGLLKLTGPIAVQGLAQPLTSANAADFLLKQQYVQFPSVSNRVDYLGDAARATFEQLTRRDLPEPRSIADALSPLTRTRRILAYSFRSQDRALLNRVGLSGSVPRPDGNDYLSVTNSNANANKIDAYLTRSITDDVRVDPASGRVDADVRVTLSNSSPSAGLPPYVIGNLAGLPNGTNRTLFSLYSGLDLSSATLNGQPLPLEPQREGGRNRYTTFLDVPPGGRVTVLAKLSGTVRGHGRYRLTYLGQPVVNPDRVALRVSTRNRRGARRATVRGPAIRPTVQDSGAGLAGIRADTSGGILTFSVPFLT